MFMTTRRSATPPAQWLEMSNRLDRLVRDALGGFDWPPQETATTAWVPVVDILEQPEAIRIQAELPGVKPEDVRLSVEGNVLTISGSKQQVTEEQTEKVHRYERTYGAFERVFTLPATVDAGAIKAAYEHGVLTVTLPKVEKAKPRQIQVQVTGS